MTQLDPADVALHVQFAERRAEAINCRREAARLLAHANRQDPSSSEWHQRLASRYDLKPGDAIDANGGLHRGAIRQTGLTHRQAHVAEHGPVTVLGHAGSSSVRIHNGGPVTVRTASRLVVLRDGESIDFRGTARFSSSAPATLSIVLTSETIEPVDAAALAQPVLSVDGWSE